MMANDTTGSPRAVLWDLDGTLIDSVAHHWTAWRDTMLAEGVEITYAQFLATFGKKNDLILQEWLGGHVAADRVLRIGEQKEGHYRRLVAQRGVTTLPGAPGWVARLRADGWRQAIASSAPRLNVAAVMEFVDFGGAFGAVVTGDDVSAGKPDPEVFLTAAAHLGVPPSRSIVVEDAAAGIEGARRAGMRAVGVSPHVALDADVAARSLEDLPPGTFDRLLART